MTQKEKIRQLDAENARLSEAVEEYEEIFKLRWKADVRAIARWRAVDPEARQLTMPDHADLCEYLINAVMDLAEQNLKLKNEVTK